MARLFAGLEIPSAIRAQLLTLQSGVPGARWRPDKNLHMTLRFIGDVGDHTQRDIDSALAHIDVLAFDLQFQGAGQFGNNRPRALWVGVKDGTAVSHLAKKIEAALQRNGLEPERRKFTPHVTLAYLNGVRRAPIDAFVADNANFKSDRFSVDRFVLFQSHLGKGGSHYVPRAHYQLTGMMVAEKD